MNNVQSPRVDDAGIEAELAAKAVAPRVTPADLEAAIAETHYFTAAEGVRGAAIEDGVEDGGTAPLGLLTFCVLTLRNGFTVTGESACASPENFNADIGQKIARENAKQKLWPLLGYALKERLYLESRPGAPAPQLGPATEPGYQQRLRNERDEVSARLAKLQAFLSTPTYDGMDYMERYRLWRQAQHMGAYVLVLEERIEAITL